MLPLLLLLSLIGLFLPPRFALRIGGVGVILALSILVYFNTPYDPGAGHALGVAMLGSAFALFFGAILLGLVVRGVWALRAGPAQPIEYDCRRLDQLLAAFAMVVPAGVIAMALGNRLSGGGHPLGVHLALLAGLAGTAVFALMRTGGLSRAALIGLALWLALITADSLRLDGQLRADLARVSQDTQSCLAIGPNAMPLDRAPPLMGLTAPKPILLLVGTPATKGSCGGPSATMALSAPVSTRVPFPAPHPDACPTPLALR